MDCAFVGAGAVATKYAAGLDESRLRLAAVCDRDVDRAERLADEHGATPYEDLGAMLDGEGAPLVVNLTGHGAHAAVTREALAADRHVYSEKPLAMDGDEAAALVELAESRGLALGCAPINPDCEAQRHAGELLADGRLGQVRMGYTHAHVGRVTEWHDDPGAFLAAGPLYDGAVYPLTLLVTWFGPVETVRAADAVDAWPAREDRAPDGPAHVEATLAFAAGPVVSLTASMYVPHRAREFNSLELHGDDGSLYLADSGATTADRETVSVGGAGRAYVAAPPPGPPRDRSYLDGPDRLAAAVEAGRTPTAGARRAAHVVAVCGAVEAAAGEGGPRTVPSRGATSRPPPSPPVRPDPERAHGTLEGPALRLPPVGFGCSRYRDGEYVDRIDSVATALDAGYRLLDSAELYGNEARIGRLLDRPGAPDRDGLFLVSKAWNTNHEHVAEACEGSRSELGVDALDCYMLHWPDAWAYQGPLRELAERPPDEQETLTFPTDEDGDPETVDAPLSETWQRMEALHDRGLARTLGICNVSVEQLSSLCATARVPPAIVQVERHPYRPRTRLVDWCHRRGIRVVAHTPLAGGDVLGDAVVRDVAADRGVSPAAVVLAWHVRRGVVPIPSSNDPDHVVGNLAASRRRPTAEELTRIDALGTGEGST